MPELGRPSASSGNAYHDVTTALRLVEMLRDADVISVRPEATSPVDDIETTFQSGLKRLEQIKESSPGTSWTANSFKDEVLPALRAAHKLDGRTTFKFVTASPAPALRELTERARSAMANHDTLKHAADEWWDRLSRAQREYAVTLRVSGLMSNRTMLPLLARLVVEESQGSLGQRRDLLRASLTGLVDDPVRAAEALETLARDSSNHETANRPR